MLDENSLAKRGFGWSPSETHIFGYTDPFFKDFLNLISPADVEKKPFIIFFTTGISIAFSIHAISNALMSCSFQITVRYEICGTSLR